MEVTAAFLADAARVEAAKLYVHGGGWDTISVENFPATHPTMALVWILKIEYDEALDEIPMAVSLLDEDDRPVGPQLEGVITTGHAPRQKRGAPNFVPQTLTLNMVPFEQAGGYRFKISSGEKELQSVSFRVMLTKPRPRTQ